MIYVLHFLRGASWGLIFIGALFYFSYFLPESEFIFSAVLYASGHCFFDFYVAFDRNF